MNTTEKNSPELLFGGDVSDLLETVLSQPVRSLMDRPSKRIRAQLVELGFEFSGCVPAPELCHGCEQVVEAVHAGSLAIDDIQDGSLVRRGQPTLHRSLGVPLAINTGNWLYFRPLEQVREMGLSADQELRMYRAYHHALLQAHYGQALDVGVPVDSISQSRVYEVCLSSLELKSGMLTSLALVLGAIAGGAEESLVRDLDRFGCAFGIALQMFDDLGNLTGKKEPEKKWEDLKLRRPSWFWAWLSRHLTEGEYRDFVACVQRLPDELRLQEWMESHPDYLKGAIGDAHKHLDLCLDELGAQLTSAIELQAFAKLKDLGGRLRVAYQ
ncbi:MAG: polyprenyl synthetase family protein [Bdellovibrionaceae bacterium]|nr:polyprenyl synthetase family protein [Bdellovibrionales bacterium]MCB9253715.1 polyprenyl synthetase family protein [Pseudobdellovibrionaceae bacterium]